jgi:hypothetical protein
MSIRVHRCGYGIAAAVFLLLTPVTAIANADDPPSPDDTVLDAVDSVLAETNPKPVTPPAPTPPPPRAVPGA